MTGELQCIAAAGAHTLEGLASPLPYAIQNPALVAFASLQLTSVCCPSELVFVAQEGCCCISWALLDDEDSRIVGCAGVVTYFQN